MNTLNKSVCCATKLFQTILFTGFLLIYNSTMAQNLPDDYEFNTEEAMSVFSLRISNFGSKLSYEPAKQSFTITAQVIFDSDITGYQVIASKGNEQENQPGWTLAIGEGRVGFRICELNVDENDDYSAGIQAPIPTSLIGKTINITAIVNRSSDLLELYVNGSKLNSYSGAFGASGRSLKDIGMISSKQAPLMLGVSENGVGLFFGTIVNFRIYGRQLQEWEINASMPAGLKNLIINQPHYNFVFDEEYWFYRDVEVPMYVDAVTITPIILGNAAVTINGFPVESEEQSLPIVLKNAKVSNEIEVEVMADNAIKTIKLNITKSNQFFYTTSVFKAGEGEYNCFRMPTIVRASNGDLLAFAEARKQNCTNNGNIDIVMKRSTNEGISWGVLSVVADFAKHTNSKGELYGTKNGDMAACNPTVVVNELNNSEILLMYNLYTNSEKEIRRGNGNFEIWVQKSSDQGKTWSSAKNITEAVNHPDLRWYACGPGHGLVIKSGAHTGRIVFSAHHTNKSNEVNSHIIYSDDWGENWKTGSDMGMNTYESSLALTVQGSLISYSRPYLDENFRKTMISTTGGESWEEQNDNIQLLNTNCFTGLINYPRGGMLLYSSPANEMDNTDMTVYVSFDDGKRWDLKRTIGTGFCAYSDMVITKQNKIGVLYEGGAESYGKIVFSIFDFEWLMQQ